MLSSYLEGRDLDGDSLTFTLKTLPAHGTVEVNSTALPLNGTFTQDNIYGGVVQVTSTANGPGSFTFTMTDGNATTAVQTFRLDVNLNTAPVAVSSSNNTLDEDSSFQGQVTATDADNDTLTYLLSMSPQNGKVVLNSDNGTFVYTPDLNYNGIDAFTFTASDQNKLSMPATVSFFITAVNDKPTAYNGRYATNMDTAVPVKLAAADLIESSALTFSHGTPEHGTLNGVGANLTYTPEASWEGVDSFTFFVNDGDLDSDNATITVEVAGEAVINNLPFAYNDTFKTVEDTSFSGVLRAADQDGDPLTYTVVQPGSSGSSITITNAGTGAFTYVPALNDTGVDTFTFKATDGKDNSNTATVTMTISKVNDPPLISGKPIATVPINQSYSFTPTASDPDGDLLSFSATGLPSWASVNYQTGTISTNGTSLAGTTYGIILTVSDGVEESSLAPFDLTVVGNTPETVARPRKGTYNKAQEVTLTCYSSDNCTIYYTMDGTVPDTSSQSGVNTAGPITINSDTILKYFAVNGSGSEPVKSSNYLIDTGMPTASVTTPAANSLTTTLTTITGLADDLESGLQSVTIQLTDGTNYLVVENGAGRFVPQSVWLPIVLDSAAGSWSFQMPAGLTLSVGSYSVIVRAIDHAGNERISALEFWFGDTALQDFSQISINLSSPAIKTDGTVDVRGTFSRYPAGGGSLAGLNITLSVMDSNNNTVGSQSTTTNADGSYTFAAVGGFIFKDTYSLRVDFNATIAMTASHSSANLMVGSAAGYVVLVEGKITNEEGLNSHNLTANRIYNQFIRRGFLAEDILYFNHDNTQPGVDSLPAKTAIQQAITTDLRLKLNGSPAPFYVVMVDHGDVDTFYLGGDGVTISPTELNNWLSELEINLTAEASQEKRIIVLGSCYSGSFINILSGQNRVIISSAAANEESYKGPLEGYETVGTNILPIRVGEYFLEEFFNEMGKGISLANSFTAATSRTETFTRTSGAGLDNRYFDSASQHPLLDDNGDGIGSNDLSAEASDGNATASMFLGIASGASAATQSSITRFPITDSLYLAAGSNLTSATLWAEASGQIPAAWIEIRRPAKVLIGQNSSGQLTNDLERIQMNYNSAKTRWEATYTGFLEEGKYEIYYFLRNQTDGTLMPMQSSLVYRNRQYNHPPQSFTLLSPDPAQVTTQKTVLTFDWEDALDPDDDRLSYTLSIATDRYFNKIVYRQREIGSSSTYVDQTAGLADRSRYYWKIEAVDSYGGLSKSSQTGSFTTYNAGTLPGIVHGVVFDRTTWQRIKGATVTSGNQTKTIEKDGYFALALPPGTVSISATYGGYNDTAALPVSVISNTATTMNIAMTANGLSTNAAAYSAVEDTLISEALTGSALVNGFEITSQPTRGTVSLASDNATFTYTPMNNTYGPDSFTFRGYDANGNYTDINTIDISITSENDAPILDPGKLTNFSAITKADSVNPGDFISTLLGSAITDPDVGAKKGLAIVKATDQGIGKWQYAFDGGTTWIDYQIGDNATLLGVNGKTKIRFSPNNTGTGQATLTIRAWDQSDGKISNSKRVSVTPNGGATSFSTVSAKISVDVLTVNAQPAARNLSFSMPEDDFLIDQLIADDADNDALLYRIMSQVGHGQLNMVDPAVGIFSYDPEANFAGIDSFTYRAFDGRDYSNTATINLTVTPVNDPPVAMNSRVSTYAQTAIAITMKGSDPDSSNLTYTVSQISSGGTLSGATGAATRTYTPAAGTTTDFFMFTVSDGQGVSSAAKVTITVSAQPNRAPTAVMANNSFTTIEDTVFRGNLTATDADNDPLVYKLVSSASKGKVEMVNVGTGAFRYTPHENQYGVDYFYFKAIDPSQTSATSAVKITITGTDDPPVISGVPGRIAQANSLYSFTPTASDPDGDPLTFTVENMPIWNTVSFDSNSGKLSGTPLSSEAGVSRAITIAVSDGKSSTTLAPFDLVTASDSTAPVTVSSIPAGIYNKTLQVNLSCFDNDGNCTIYYSDNDTPPTTASPSGVNTVGPITVDQTTTLRYFAVDSVSSPNTETLRTSSYTIDTTPPSLAIVEPLNDAALSKLDWINIDAEDMDTDVATIELQISDGAQYYNGTTFNAVPAWITALYSNALGMWTYQSSNVPWSDNATYSVMARATDLAGNTAIDTVLFSYTSGPVKQAYTTLFLEAASKSLIVNDHLTVSGKLSRLPETGMSLSQRQVKLTVVRPDNSELAPTFEETYDQFGHFTFSNVSGFDRRGQFSLRADYIATPLLAASSAVVNVQVASGAGYAILLQGEGANSQDEQSHFLTTSRVYNNLKHRGFTDDNILLLTPETSKSGWDGLPGRAALQDGLQIWLADKMLTSYAPIYLIMTGDAANNNFVLNSSETVSASDLNSWLTSMEDSLNTGTGLEDRVIIIGASNSGSFIPQLSKNGRIIVASAAPAEQASRGPLERNFSTQQDSRTADYFLENLFTELGHGYSLHNSFEKARDIIDQTRRASGWRQGTGTVFMDNSVQHPLLDDNGDGSGSNDLYSGRSEGSKSARIFLGTGATYNTNSALNPAEITTTTETVYLANDETTTLIDAKVNDNSQVGTIWCEVRDPATSLRNTSQADQVATPLNRYFLTYNPATDRWEAEIEGFNELGKYEIFYYVTDLATGNLATMQRSTVYKNLAGNNPPLSFGLKSPLNNATSQTVLTFKWDKTTDADNDTLTYTLVIAADPAFSYVVYRSEELQSPYAMVDSAANLKDLSSYYWKVQAVDVYGAVQESNESRHFSTDNTNAEPPGILELMMISSLDWSLISGAQAVNALDQALLASIDEIAATDLAAGTYTVTGTAPGYTNTAPTSIEVTSGKITKVALEMDKTLATTNTSVMTNEDVPVSSYLIANSTGNLTFSITTDGTKGHAVVTNSATGAFTYTPNLNVFGSDSFSFTAEDGTGGSDNGTITVTIVSVNDAPVAKDYDLTMDEDTQNSIAPLSEATDVDGDTLTISSISQGAHGTVVKTGNNLAYTPNANYHGDDSFTYEVNDGNGGSDNGTISVTINQVNDSPIATNDTMTTDEDTAATISPLGNDNDIDADQLNIGSVSQGSHGTVTYTATEVTYTPSLNYNGSDSFTYVVSDGNGGSDNGTITVTINAINDAPQAKNDNLNTKEDTAKTINPLLNDTDIDADPLTISSVSQGVHGLVTFGGTDVTYTPELNYNGSDSFTYVVSDGNGGSDNGTITVTVTLVNDQPSATPDSLTTAEDTAKTFDPRVNDSDIDGDTLTISAIGQGTHGTVSTTGTSVTYTPELNYNGSDSFTYVVSDGNGGSDNGTVTVTVTPVNDPPTAVMDTLTTVEEMPRTIDPRANDIEVDGDALTITSASQGAHGTVTFTDTDLTYTPAWNYYGSDSFTYVVSDSTGKTDTGKVNVTINEIIPGDINGNGTVELQDLIQGIRFVSGKEITGRFFVAADVNGDHRINMIDVVYITRVLSQQ